MSKILGNVDCNIDNIELTAGHEQNSGFPLSYYGIQYCSVCVEECVKVEQLAQVLNINRVMKRACAIEGQEKSICYCELRKWCWCVSPRESVE